MNAIRFGTDGWSAIIADEFTSGNVRLVAQAIARYAFNSGNAGCGLVIGYDSRFLSERFAAVAAEVISGNGIPVLMTEKATPTPVVAYAVRELGAAGAVMITAGHRSPEHNGVKFIPGDTGFTAAESNANIEDYLNRLTASDVRLLPIKTARERGLVRLIDPKPNYLAHLHGIMKYNTVCRGQLRVVIDPMWGAGIGYLDDLLREGCSKIEVIHGNRDVLCEGQLPEPAESNLADLRKAVMREQADLGLALDGDAGRFGVIDRDGSYLTPNEIIYMLLHYLTEYRNWRGAVARTVATTHMIDRIAAEYGLPVVETPVGFQYVGQSLIKHRSILGGEENGGLSVQGHVPVGDGILALALVVEMVASSHGMSLRAYQEEIQQKFGKLVNGRLDLPCDPDQKNGYLSRLEQWSPREINGRQVIERHVKDGVKLVLDDGSWVLVRSSSTEPLLRVYSEAPDVDNLDRLQLNACQALGLDPGIL